MITVTFAEHDGATKLTAREVHPSPEALQAALGAGMEHGMRETMDQLAALLAANAT